MQFFLVFNFFFFLMGDCIVLLLLLLLLVLAEAIITKHCLWEAFPDLPFLFALVPLPHLSHGINISFGGLPIFLITL